MISSLIKDGKVEGAGTAAGRGCRSACRATTLAVEALPGATDGPQHGVVDGGRLPDWGLRLAVLGFGNRASPCTTPYWGTDPG